MLKIAHHLNVVCLVALTVFGAGQVLAQPAGGGGGPGPGPRASAPGPQASAPGPRMGMGPGAGPRAGASAPGPGMGRGGMGARGPRWGADYTPGWALMSPQERDEHRARMQGAKTYDECNTLRQQHRDQMVARARERGASAPLAQPRRDACAGLPKP